MESIISNSVATAINNGAASNGNHHPSASHSKNATEKLIRENVNDLIEQLEAGRSEALTTYLRAMAVFKNYSFLC